MSNVVTDVRVFPIAEDKQKGAAVAFGSFTVSGAVAVKVTICKNKKDGSLFVSFPSRSYEKDGETQYADQAFPITKEAREEIQNKVLTAYEAEMNKTGTGDNVPQEAAAGGGDVPW